MSLPDSPAELTHLPTAKTDVAPVSLTRAEGRAVVDVGGLPEGAVCAAHVMVVSAQDHWRLWARRDQRQKAEVKGQVTSCPNNPSTWKSDLWRGAVRPFLGGSSATPTGAPGSGHWLSGDRLSGMVPIL